MQLHLADGTVYIDDYGPNQPSILDDGIEKITAIAIAAEHQTEFNAWLPNRSESSVDCDDCNSTGWRKLGELKFICNNCGGLGWIPSPENA